MTTSAVASYSPPRTYPIPKAVVEEALQGYRWARAYGTEVPVTYQHSAAVLASAGSVDTVELNRLNRLHRARTLWDEQAPEGWNPGEETYPAPARILASLAGGLQAYEWSERILSSIEKADDENRTKMLASIGHDPERFCYLGICASGEPDVLTMLVRAPKDGDGATWSQWDVADNDWSDITLDDITGYEAVSPDEPMLAELVASLTADESLLLSYADPVAFLPTTPTLVASVAPDDVESDIVYAVVDELDHTAVLAAVKVSPGPEVMVRESGAWVADQEFQDWFVSSDPPTLVALGADMLDVVLAQADALKESKIDQAIGEASVSWDMPPTGIFDSDHALKIANRLRYELQEIQKLKSALGEFESRRENLNDRINELTRTDEGSRETFRRFLDNGPTDAELDEAYEIERGRRSDLRTALDGIEVEREMLASIEARIGLQASLRAGELSSLIQSYENLNDAAIVSAAKGGWDRNRGNAETLRRYWTRGRGAAKIRWGTKGDWRRCYRQLFKHLGPRAKGYCALRHREVTGLWTGDKLHRRGVNTIRAGVYPLSAPKMSAVPLASSAVPATGGAQDTNIGLWVSPIRASLADDSHLKGTSDVLRVGDRFQVFGADAQLYSAEVVDLQSVRNGTHPQLVSSDVRRTGLSVVIDERSVSLAASASGEQPAPVGLGDARKETVFSGHQASLDDPSRSRIGLSFVHSGVVAGTQPVGATGKAAIFDGTPSLGSGATEGDRGADVAVTLPSTVVAAAQISPDNVITFTPINGADSSLHGEKGTAYVIDHAMTAAGTGEGSANPEAHTGVMVALYPPPEVAKKLAIPDGEGVEELHVTLAFLGDSTEYEDSQEQVLVDVITAWSKTQGAIEGVYSGKGIFVGEDIPEGAVTFRTPDLPALPTARQSLVELLESVGGVVVASNHGFTPHTSVGYGDRLADVEVEETPVRFESISVVWGSSRTDITLGDTD